MKENKAESAAHFVLSGLRPSALLCPGEELGGGRVLEGVLPQELFLICPFLGVAHSHTLVKEGRGISLP